MAAHNYYGFTPGGTINQYSSYSAPAATAYTPTVTQPTYSAVQPSAQYGPYGSRIQGYDDVSSYYTAQAAANVGYGASAAAFGQTPTSSSSGAKSNYYQSSAASGSSSNYYSQSSSVSKSGSGTSKKAEVKASEWQSISTGDKKGTGSWQQPTSSYANTYSASTSSQEASTSSAPLSGLDKALFTIAANYCQSQKAGGAKSSAAGTRAMWWNKKGKMPTDPSQWKYCELCKMTCPGTQAYKLHLEGKIHKKKEAAVASKAVVGPKAPNQKPLPGRVAFCSVCDTYCSSADAYAAHLRGIKHQKVVKLLTRLGKPIPDDSQITIAMSSSGAGHVAAAAPTASVAPVVKKVYCTPKITFVGGTQLKTTAGHMEEVKVPTTNVELPVSAVVSSNISSSVVDDGEEGSSDASIQPIGLEYIEEGMNDARTAPSFFCKLCACHFTDIMGKIMHSKGRRHRLQYKKKVDPTLKVEVKISPYDRRMQLEKLKRNRSIPEQWRKREIQATYKLEAEELRYEKEVLQWKLQEVIGGRYVGPSSGTKPWATQQSTTYGSVQQGDFTESIGRCIQSRHVAIYPTEAELSVVQLMIAAVEKSLKQLSDFFAERDSKLDDGKQQIRVLKGVMRIGLLCKGLLLHDGLNMQLVILCSGKPTETLVRDIADNLPAQLALCVTADEKYEVTTDGSDIFITNSAEPTAKCVISVTSPAVKSEGDDEASKLPNPPDMLDEAKSIMLLAELRHAKWFQAKVTPTPSSLVVIRLLMDLCARDPVWSALSQWALELLVEKCSSSITSTGAATPTPTRLLIQVMECISSGILLPDAVGIYDVCEKEPTDAISYMTSQQREDLTASAQHMLRQLMLGFAHKVLDVDALPQTATNVGASQCKRPRISSA